MVEFFLLLAAGARGVLFADDRRQLRPKVHCRRLDGQGLLAIARGRKGSV